MMNEEVLREYAYILDRKSSTQETMCGDPSEELNNAMQEGRRRGLKEAADGLCTIMEIFGGQKP